MTEPQLNGLLSAVRTVLILIGTFMLQNGLGQSDAYKNIELAASAILIVGPGVWGIYAAIAAAFAKKQATTVGVNAGLKLAASGNMVDMHGNPVSFGAGAGTPPRPATDESAQAIVKDYGPA